MAVPPPSTPAAAHQDTSQLRQKEMIARHYDRLADAPDAGEKCAYTFVPGNLTELLHSFDLLPVLPEINSLQWGMRGKTGEYIGLAEKLGHSEDVCTYVKSDIGMLKSGNVGPTGRRMPNPDVLLLSYCCERSITARSRCSTFPIRATDGSPRRCGPTS
jgi:benzoyl-CoA reductase subunit B